MSSLEGPVPTPGEYMIIWLAPSLQNRLRLRESLVLVRFNISRAFKYPLHPRRLGLGSVQGLQRTGLWGVLQHAMPGILGHRDSSLEGRGYISDSKQKARPRDRVIKSTVDSHVRWGLILWAQRVDPRPITAYEYPFGLILAALVGSRIHVDRRLPKKLLCEADWAERVGCELAGKCQLFN